MALVPRSDRWLSWGCFIALITTAFGFILRIFLMDGWAKEFDLSATQQGELMGVGLWPFAIRIVLFASSSTASATRPRCGSASAATSLRW